ncbi:NADH dehydrogenase 1 alpha subcomplex subunit 10, mitochondrial [Nephila pilipes]|uniref:NADH dehydrogenase [ubiquinone] 1 alpha subcomplex subunit 10, mitochondrial n=1 Tax=Nephila pilipes TaxID=299642 RepID=A0A8X6NS10_NEPPI|nr:NADH dehydrogenase 1 alpha subcomplex subunit 10, mitochondrial [Nephila pilipes]
MSITCLPRLIKFEVKRCGFILASTPRFAIIQTASITSKEWRDPNIKKPAPWPYKTKRFNLFRAHYESTIKRFDENTKVIVVDGNIASGKGAFAKELAEAFDMHFVPEPTLEKIYLTAYGYDLRQLNPIVPPSFKICDIETFYKNPHHQNVAKFQFDMYMLRLEAYIDALAHLLNTGQGIVMERSAFGDFVFVEAMYKAGYLSKQVKDFYYEITKVTLDELMKPHLIIYLDVNPEVILERIKNRNNPAEVNSPVLNKNYLQSIDDFYKQQYLKEFLNHSEVLIYDWNNYGDVEVVVEDIERIDFDRFTKYDSQMKDWRKRNDWEWGYYRQRYTNRKDLILSYGVINKPKIHEVYHPGEEWKEYLEILNKIPGEKYSEGFNPMAGDSVLFKTENKGYWYGGINRTLR